MPAQRSSKCLTYKTRRRISGKAHSRPYDVRVAAKVGRRGRNTSGSAPHLRKAGRWGTSAVSPHLCDLELTHSSDYQINTFQKLPCHFGSALRAPCLTGRRTRRLAILCLKARLRLVFSSTSPSRSNSRGTQGGFPENLSAIASYHVSASDQ